MSKFKLIQTQYNAFRDAVVDRTMIGEFRSLAQATDFLVKRGYSYDSVAQAWIAGNTVQFPVVIEEVKLDLFDIRSFV